MMQYNTLRFENAFAVASESFGPDKNLTLITTDSDYLFAGKRLKDEFTENGFLVTALALDDGILDTTIFELLTNSVKGNVAVVGSSMFLNIARAVFMKRQSRVILVATDLNFFSVISDYALVTSDNRLSVVKLPYYTTVIDSKIVVALKKTVIMQGFLEVVSKLCYLVDYVNSRLLNKSEVDENYISELLRIICSLKKLDGDYAKSVLSVINAQYLLAEFSKKYDVALFSEECFIGDLLSKATGENFYSCQYSVFSPLIELYTLVLKNDTVKNIRIVPDYRTNIEKLSELKKADKSVFLANYKPLAKDEILAVDFKNLSSASDYYKKFEACFYQLESRIVFLFGGRKKICRFTASQMQNALRLSGYQQATDFYKIINDSGVFDCFE